MPVMTFFEYLNRRRVIELRSGADGIEPNDGTSLCNEILRYCKEQNRVFEEVLKEFAAVTDNEVISYRVPTDMCGGRDDVYVTYRAWYVRERSRLLEVVDEVEI